jgi:ADP-ribosylglycohydrolase
MKTQLWLALPGVLLGTAVGDALGLPAEGLSPTRIGRRWPGPWRHRFCLGRGMISDDTEHTLFVAQALLSHSDDVKAFQQSLAWKLRLWLLGMPAAERGVSGRGADPRTPQAVSALLIGTAPEWQLLGALP